MKSPTNQIFDVDRLKRGSDKAIRTLHFLSKYRIFNNEYVFPCIAKLVDLYIKTILKKSIVK